jgi:hypothetical protein
MPTFRNTLSVPSWVGTYSPLKMEQTGCSETLAFKLQAPVNHPEQSIRLSTFPAEEYRGSNISCVPLMTVLEMQSLRNVEWAGKRTYNGRLVRNEKEMAVVYLGIASRQLIIDRAVVMRVHVKVMCRREGSAINVETESCWRELMKE